MRSRHARACVATALVALCALIVAFGARAAPPEPFAHGLLFRVDAPGTPPSYIFGTLHSNDPRVTRAPPVRWRSARASRYAWRRNRAGSKWTRREFLAAAQYDDGRRLADHFDAATLARIRAALGARAPRDEEFERLEAVGSAADAGAAARQADDASLDGVLQADARRRGRQVLGLELPDEQVASLDAIPLASQVALVHWALAHADGSPAEHEATVRAWLARRSAAARARSPSSRGASAPTCAPHFAALSRAPGRRPHGADGASPVPAAARGRCSSRSARCISTARKGLLALIREQGYRVSASIDRRASAPWRRSPGRLRSKRVESFADARASPRALDPSDALSVTDIAKPAHRDTSGRRSTSATSPAIRSPVRALVRRGARRRACPKPNAMTLATIVDGRAARGAHRAAQGRRRARLRVLHELRQPQGARARRATRTRRCCSSGPSSSARCASKARSSAVDAADCRRLFRERGRARRASAPGRRRRATPLPDRALAGSALRRSRAALRDPATTSRGRRTGAAIALVPDGSSSGRDAPRACTIASCTGATATGGASGGSRREGGARHSDAHRADRARHRATTSC